MNRIKLKITYLHLIGEYYLPQMHVMEWLLLSVASSVCRQRVASEDIAAAKWCSQVRRDRYTPNRQLGARQRLVAVGVLYSFLRV